MALDLLVWYNTVFLCSKVSNEEAGKDKKGGQSDGGCKVNSTWYHLRAPSRLVYEPPNFPLQNHWLKGGGLDASNEYVA
eukprot:1157754-Pelagomonas_calceolata.AAC.6